MQRIVPNLWFNKNAEEAADFYCRAFPRSRTLVTGRYPETGLADFQKDFAGLPVVVSVWIQGSELTLINSNDTFRPNSAISLMANFAPLQYDGAGKAVAAIDEAWAVLSDGGKVLMPLQSYPFSDKYGWVEDKYGVSWQLILTDPESEPASFLMPALMFAGRRQNQAKEAIDFYVASLPEAEVEEIYSYEEDEGPATTESIMYGAFTTMGQWIVAMDSGVEQDLSFNPGVSLEIRCNNQEQIDQVWDALTANPAAEQCGWLEDKFGVSWQVVPENIDELMEHPDAFQHMMGMKKLIIEDF